MGSFRSLAEVVDTPVEAIDEHVHHEAVSSGRATHVEHRLAHPLVADHRATTALAGVTVNPGVIVSGA